MTGAGKTMTGADFALREKFGTGFLPSWEGLETSGKGKSAVLVPFFPAGSGLRLLFLRRSPDLRHHAGEVCFPGGMREPGDVSPLDTALRETEEETAIRAQLVEPLSVLPVEYAVVSGVAVVPVAGIVRGIDPDSDLVLSSGEIEGSVTIAIEDLSPDPVMQTVVIDGKKHCYPEYFLPNGWRIWGVTGRILFRVLQAWKGGNP